MPDEGAHHVSFLFMRLNLEPPSNDFFNNSEVQVNNEQKVGHLLTPPAFQHLFYPYQRA
jgi:hypothetical protein